MLAILLTALFVAGIIYLVVSSQTDGCPLTMSKLPNISSSSSSASKTDTSKEEFGDHTPLSLRSTGYRVGDFRDYTTLEKSKSFE
jgi:hypothetical protein